MKVLMLFTAFVLAIFLVSVTETVTTGVSAQEGETAGCCHAGS